jgi:hypothetical protein
MKPTQEHKLDSIDSLEEIEGAITSVTAHRGYNLGIFPSALGKRRGSLRDAAYLQVLLTWARLSPTSRLNLLGSPGAEKSALLREACDYSIGLAAMAIAGEVSVAGTTVPRALALAHGKDRIDAAYRGDFDALVKGRTLDLLCVSGAERQYLKPLFDAPSPQKVKDKYDLKAMVRGLAMRAAPTATDFDDNTVAALATLTHELFENTQDHAVTDASGEAYRRHVELLNTGWVTISDQESQNDLRVNAQLRAYWSELIKWQPHERKVAGICFNFLDSGPGMAARLMGRKYFQMTDQEEAEALRNCLRLHVTSKQTHGTGGGLQAVLTEVAQASGFVRIRSGRQAIFRCFLPGHDTGDVCRNFENWFGPDQVLQPVAGTLVSVFFPLPRPSV